MKFAAPSQNWTKHFAIVPTRMNCGDKNCHQVVWLESYYVRTQTTMGKPELMLMSEDDYNDTVLSNNHGKTPNVSVTKKERI